MPTKPKTIDEIYRFGATLFFFRTEYKKRTAWLEQNSEFDDCRKSYEHVYNLLPTVDEEASTALKTNKDYVNGSIGKILDGMNYSLSGHRSTAYPDLESYTDNTTKRMLNVDPEIMLHLSKLLELSLKYGMLAPDIFNLYSYDKLIPILIKNSDAVNLHQTCYEFPKTSTKPAKWVQWLTSDGLSKRVKFLKNSESLFSDKLILLVDYLDENLNIDECLKVIRGHILEKRIHQTMVKSISTGNSSKQELSEETARSHLKDLKRITPHSFDIESVVRRLIGLAMWDRIHINKLDSKKAFQELIDNNIIIGYSKKCDLKYGCGKCENISPGNIGCFGKVRDYYKATNDCVKAGNVLSVSCKHNRKKHKKRLERLGSK